MTNSYLEKLVVASHRKSAYAVYSFEGYRLEVYLRNNVCSANAWGKFFLSCYLKSKSQLSETERFEFDNYADFRTFRLQLQNRIELNN